MEENVALDSSKQRKFLKGIKKLIKKNEAGKVKVQDETKPDSSIVKKDKKAKKPRKERGLVYLSHIPHGFYEHQMTEYFKQFGMVTNVRVIRSKRTGNSKGYGFVEFRDPSVAQIVAETMNNYLMGKRLIKAIYIPPEKQRRHAFRKHWNPQNNPGRDARLKKKKEYNADKDEKTHIKKAKQLLSNLNKTKKRLREIGINYDFFMPVDIPAGLNVLPIVKQEKSENDDIEVNDEIITVKNEDSTVKKNKVKKEKTNKNKNIKKEKTKPAVVETTKDGDIKPKKQDKRSTPEVDNYMKNKSNNKVKSEKGAATAQDTVSKKNKKDTSSASQINIVKQNAKKEIKPLKDLVEVQNENDSEDASSDEFDSDEFEKMMDNDDSEIGSDDAESDEEAGSDDDDGDDENIDDESETDEDDTDIDGVSDNVDSDVESDEVAGSDDEKNDDNGSDNLERKVTVSKKNKQNNQQKRKVQPRKAKVEEKPLPPKRKGNQKPDVATKKSKFEKQVKQKPKSKLFKKK